MSKNVSFFAATAILILSGCGGGSGVGTELNVTSNSSSVSSVDAASSSSKNGNNALSSSGQNSMSSTTAATSSSSKSAVSSSAAGSSSSKSAVSSSVAGSSSSKSAVSSSVAGSSSSKSAVSSSAAGSSSTAGSSSISGGASGSSWYHPTVKTTWQWQLQGTINKSYDVNVYDIDVFDTSAATISALHADGRKVICYFSAGSYEAWREDAKDFPDEALGSKMDGWDERWLDIRNKTVRSIMAARMDLAKSKGCDGVEPDNVDGYDNSNGFGLTANDQIDYNTFLAQSAHDRNLAVGLKNDVEQVAALEPYFDFCVNEECHDYDECDVLASFISHNKPVFNAEYASKYKTAATLSSLCEDAKNRKFQTLYLPLDLDDSFRYSCSE